MFHDSHEAFDLLLDCLRGDATWKIWRPLGSKVFDADVQGYHFDTLTLVNRIDDRVWLDMSRWLRDNIWNTSFEE